MGAAQVGLRGLEAGLGGDSVGRGGLHRGLVRIYVRRGLHVFQLSQQLTPLHMIALLDVKMGDLSVGIGADVNVRLRLDFTRSAYHRCQIQVLGLTRLDCDYVLAALVDGESHDRDHEEQCADTNNDLFPGFHDCRHHPC